MPPNNYWSHFRVVEEKNVNRRLRGGPRQEFVRRGLKGWVRRILDVSQRSDGIQIGAPTVIDQAR